MAETDPSAPYVGERSGLRSKAEVDTLFEQLRPQFEALQRDKEGRASRWTREIAMLERRVREEFVEVDLGHGDTIAVRTCYSDAEGKRIGALEQERQALGKEKDKNLDRLDAIAFELLEIITANPFLTAEWFKNNRDKFAIVDTLEISLGYYRQQLEKYQELKTLKSFRDLDGGAELRGLPSLPADR